MHAETVRQFIGENHALQTLPRDGCARIGGIAEARFKAFSKTRVAGALLLAQRRRAIIAGVYRLLLELAPARIGILRCLLIDIGEYRLDHGAVPGAELGDGELLGWRQGAGLSHPV